jgi:hypothetical protein
VTLDDAEAAHQAAAERMVALATLGPDRGAGALIWARTVEDELERHEAARQRFAAGTADRNVWLRLHGSALTLVVAIDQVLAFESRVRKLTGDGDLARARQTFNRVGDRAGAIRDIAAHLDAYAVGEGNRQQGRGRAGEAAVTNRNVSPLIYWPDDGGTVLALGDEQLDLRATAEAAVTLAAVVERVRVRHLGRAAAEANAAFKRRWMPEFE